MPDAATLLNAAVRYLELELMPTLAGYHRFQTRVTANVLNIIRRELMMREEQESAEWVRLEAIVGQDRPLDTLNDELCELIRSGRIEVDDPALRAHIRRSLADALAINNPKWAAD
jgi:hypothetical protein